MERDEIHISPCADLSLALKFNYNDELLTVVKTIAGRRWESGSRTWYIPDSKEHLDKVLASLINLNYRVYIGSSAVFSADDDCWIHESLSDLVNALTIRKYSRNTVNSYIRYNYELLKYSQSVPANITQEDVTLFLADMIKEGDLSASTVQLVISSLRFYYGELLGRDFIYEIALPKKDRKLPVVMSKTEVRSIIDSIENLKHKTVITLIYSAGLRLSEAVTLKVSDIDIDRGVINLKGGKGRKDRTTLLSNTFLELLKVYLDIYHPDNWLFKGQEEGSHMSKRSVQSIFQNAVAKTGIKKAVTVHSLRHSFATHLLEQGVDIRYIQELLGHQNPNTTMIYTHVSTGKIKNIKSPLDI